jgi:hypothetical protein
MEDLPLSKGFMAVELVNRLVEDGIKSIKRTYEEGPRLDGALAGFDLAKALPATYEDFDWAVTQREAEERQMKLEGVTEQNRDSYRHHRWATLQLEYCRDILLVAKHASGQDLPPGTVLSARAAVRYASIVGLE